MAWEAVLTNLNPQQKQQTHVPPHLQNCPMSVFIALSCFNGKQCGATLRKTHTHSNRQLRMSTNVYECSKKQAFVVYILQQKLRISVMHIHAEFPYSSGLGTVDGIHRSLLRCTWDGDGAQSSPSGTPMYVYT